MGLNVKNKGNHGMKVAMGQRLGRTGRERCLLRLFLGVIAVGCGEGEGSLMVSAGSIGVVMAITLIKAQKGQGLPGRSGLAQEGQGGGIGRVG